MLNRLAWLLGFSALMPYPAFPIGDHSGLQAGHVVAVFITLSCAHQALRRSRHFLVVMALMLPTLPALALQPWSSTNLNSSVALFGALWVLMATSIVDRDIYADLLKGVLWAIAVHVLLGLLQQYDYRNEEFSFLSLYRNPSFASLYEGAVSWKTYALYSKRSFGLFPEPSAMVASLGPWLVLLGFLVLGPRHQLPGTFGRQRPQLLGSFVGGLVLVVLARSGGASAILLGLVPAVVLYATASWRESSPGQCVKGVAVVLAGVLTVIVTVANGADRVARELGNAASWADRANSIVYGFTSLHHGDWLDFLFGYGLGAVAPMTQAATGATSVHSWIGSYIMGTGVTGALALAGVVLYLVQQISRSTRRVMGYSVLFVWLFSALLVSGYTQLLTMWLSLGLLLHWRHLHD